MKAYLTTIFDTRKSFYNKAILTDELKTNTISLISYDTVVAELKGDTLKVNGYYSPTTARHINEFALQNGFDRMCKKELEQKLTIKK